MSTLKHALAVLATHLGAPDGIGEGMSHFTCEEADALLRVMVKAGYTDEAVVGLLGHAVYGEGGPDEVDSYDQSHVEIIRAYQSGAVTDDPHWTSHGDAVAARAQARAYIQRLIDR